LSSGGARAFKPELNVLILIALIGLIVAASLGYGAMQMDS
jgi:hypothetical protein